MDQFKDELAHLIVHDMKNPIFVIQGNLQMMGMGLNEPDSDVLQKYVDRIERSTQNLLRMVMNLIDITKIESGEMKLNKELVKINDLVERCVKKIREYPENSSKNIALNMANDMPMTSLDNSVIERVFDNIITFSVSNVANEGNVQINISHEQDNICCQIKDDGIQIPSEYHNAIFEKFSQVEIKNEGFRVGRGLGFTYSKLAVEAHEGRIFLDEQMKIGNNFVIQLPVQSLITN